MSSPAGHIRTLKGELDKLQRELGLIESNYRDAKEACRAVAKEFKQFAKDSEKLNRSHEKHRRELWCSTFSGNTAIAARAEERLKAVIEEQALLQREVPVKFKSWALMIKAKNASMDMRTEWKVKIALKEEEIHRLKPCDSVTCQHCKRGKVTTFKPLKQAKVGITDGMARMLRMKSK